MRQWVPGLEGGCEGQNPCKTAGDRDQRMPLVLQRQFREGCGVMPAWRRGAWHGSVGPVRYCPAYPPATAANSSGPNRSRGSIPHHPCRTCGLVIRALFPPSLLQAQQKSYRPVRHRASNGDASQPRCGSRTRPAHVAFLRLELRFYTPTGSSHVCQGLQRGILRCIGQIVAGFATVQIPAVNGPVDFAGLAPAGWTHSCWALNR